MFRILQGLQSALIQNVHAGTFWVCYIVQLISRIILCQIILSFALKDLCELYKKAFYKLNSFIDNVAHAR